MSVEERRESCMPLNAVFNNCRQMISSQIHTSGWSDSYRLRGPGVFKVEKVVALWRRELGPSFPHGQGSVRLSRLPKINSFLEDCNLT